MIETVTNWTNPDIQDDQKQAYVRQVAQRVLGLPPLPTVIAKLIELIDDPKTTAVTLERLIVTDQVLTARILRLSNSAFYGFPQRIATVKLAIVVLGFDTLKDLCVSVALRDWFSTTETDDDFDMSRFWEHSIACGVAARMTAKRYGYRVSGEMFVAGLLHDIGKLVLRQYLKTEYQEIRDILQEEPMLFFQAERRVLGVDHGDIGGWLMERWNLPRTYVESITYHHKPSGSLEHYLHTAIIHFSNYLTRYAGIGYSGDRGTPVLDEGVVSFLRIQRDEEGEVAMELYDADLKAALEQAETFINIIHNPGGSNQASAQV